VHFGLRFLEEKASKGEGRVALESVLETSAPPALAVLDSAGNDLEAIDVRAQTLRSSGEDALSQRLSAIGIRWGPEEPAAAT
jgi:hypothetical protein